MRWVHKLSSFVKNLLATKEPNPPCQKLEQPLASSTSKLSKKAKEIDKMLTLHHTNCKYNQNLCKTKPYIPDIVYPSTLYKGSTLPKKKHHQTRSTHKKWLRLWLQ